MMQNETLGYLTDHVPIAGSIQEVMPGIGWVRLPLPFKLDHVNVWLLDDGEKLALVDTGIGHADIKEIWLNTLAAVSRQLSRLIVTHGHPDHIGLAGWMASEFAIPVYITQGELLGAWALWHQLPGCSPEDMVAHFRHHGLDTRRQTALMEHGTRYHNLVPVLPTRYQRLFDGDTLRIGTNEWRIMTGYGHAPEHASLYCEQKGVLISGDMLLPRITTNISVHAATPLDDPLARFLASLQRLKPLPSDTLVLPSHGRPFRGLHERIAQLESHHQERCQMLLSLLDIPRSAADILPQLFPRELDTHQLMFAMGEAIAHFNHLVNQGTVQRQVADNKMILFKKAETSL